MLQVARSNERYHLENEWLSAYWHFSFDHYYDPKNMEFGPLRVFNNDTIQPAKGFPMHPHRDMEIVTYVINGTLEHSDSTGGNGYIRAGEVQRMSAGKGVFHSEYNASPDEPVELLQMWVRPQKMGVVPSYEQKRFSVDDRRNKLLAIADGRGDPNGAVYIGQDVTFFVSHLDAGQQVRHGLEDGRRAYLFVIDGTLSLNGETLGKGDSVKITGEKALELASEEGAEALLIDLP
jgi:redox-sensitive bicupin YhaK (pirin superfamily)